MVCYVIPALAAIAHSGMRRTISSWKKSTQHLWLSLLLAGGAIFGVVDHLWNGELFLIGDAPFLDILLGVTITGSIVVAWGVIVTLQRIRMEKPIEQTN